MCYNLSLRENWKEIFDKVLGVGGKTPRGNDGATADGPQTTFKEKWVQLMCVFLPEAYKLEARPDPQGKWETKLSLDTGGPSSSPIPHTLLSLLLNECWTHIFLTRQQIMSLAPTVMSLSSSIYNAMELKIIREKQVRKTLWLFYLTGDVEEGKTSLLRGTPGSSLSPQGSRTTESVKMKCAVCRCLHSAFLLTLMIKIEHGVLLL